MLKRGEPPGIRRDASTSMLRFTPLPACSSCGEQPETGRRLPSPSTAVPPTRPHHFVGSAQQTCHRRLQQHLNRLLASRSSSTACSSKTQAMAKAFQIQHKLGPTASSVHSPGGRCRRL
jgi:hypothetical protein